VRRPGLLYVGGEWIESTADRWIAVENPGNGRELGRHGLEEFQLVKSLQLP
jgi:hypothetical protein